MMNGLAFVLCAVMFVSIALGILFLIEWLKSQKEKHEEVVECVEIDYSDFPEGKEVTVLKLKEKQKP